MGIAEKRLHLLPGDVNGRARWQGTHQRICARFCRRDPQGTLTQASTLAESKNHGLEGKNQLVAELGTQCLLILNMSRQWVMHGITWQGKEPLLGQGERDGKSDGIAGKTK